MLYDDTIVAVSSAVGSAPRMIVRLSGPGAQAAARALCPDLPPAACASRRAAMVRELRFNVWAYVFVSPRSYSGEDLVELHLPGSPLLARLLLDELVRRGCRAAEPGEFTARAYFHGRLDLTAAEGVAATIAAANEQELRAARQLSAGELARRLRPMMDGVAQTLALVEAGIDFSEEGVSFVADDELAARIQSTRAELGRLVSQSRRFERLAHEPRAVLAGRPNAGKSTLLNALAAQPRAVVSAQAGTTRDALAVEVVLERGPLQLVDVAGLDDEPRRSDGPLSGPMRRRALEEVEAADLVVLVHDGASPGPRLDLPRRADLVVLTKMDRVETAAESEPGAVAVSALTGQNMPELRRRLDELAFGAHGGGSGLALNARHLAAVARAQDALGRAAEVVAGGAEVVALELREALDALGSILGTVSPDDVLGRIFSQFCIGK